MGVIVCVCVYVCACVCGRRNGWVSYAGVIVGVWAGFFHVFWAGVWLVCICVWA